MGWSTKITNNYGSVEVERLVIPHTDTIIVAFWDGGTSIKVQVSKDGGNTFAGAITVNNTAGNNAVALNNAMAYDEVTGRVHLLFERNQDLSGQKVSLYHVYTDDLFTTWSSVHTIDSGTGHATVNAFFRVAIWARNSAVSIHYTYETNSGFTTDGLWRTISTDGGDTFAVISKPYSGTIGVYEPNCHGFSDGTVLVSYYEDGVNNNSSGDLTIVRSSDGGLTWGQPVAITSTTDYGRPRIHSDNGNWWIVANKPWGKTAPTKNADVVALHSSDNGYTWSAPILIAAHTVISGTNYNTSHPDVTIIGNFIGITWFRANPSGVHGFVSSTDGGQTFSAEVDPYATTGAGSDASRVLMTKNYCVVFGLDTDAFSYMRVRNPDFLSILPQTQTGVIDDFNRTAEGVLSQGGNWTQGSMVGGSALSLKTNGSGVVRHSNAGTFDRSQSYRNDVTYTGNTEVWLTIGTIGGECDLQIGDPTTRTGYSLSCLDSDFTPNGVAGWRYTGGGARTSIWASNAGATAQNGDIFCLQVVGDEIAGWRYHAGAWSELARRVDTTYRSALRLCLDLAGNASVEIGDNFGGGSLTIPNNVTLPVLSGQRVVGNVLSCDSGTWTYAPGTVVTYQWQSSPDGITSWTNISGATLSFYTVVDASVHYQCVVTAYNPVGTNTATSNQLPAAPVPPKNTADVPGKSPYTTDDTRRWIEAYRVGNKIKPALVIRAATDANYINGHNVYLPTYNNTVLANAVCNIISPGQRLTGCLSWSVTEDIGNIAQTAQLTVLDALPQSRITTTISAFGVGTKGDTITSISQMPQQWHSTTIRYQWVMNGLGISTLLPKGNIQISSVRDPTLAGNIGFTQNYQESNLLYRFFEPEVIQVSDLSQFPDPAVPVAESEGVIEWWDTDITGSLKGVGAYYILVGQEVMRVTRIDRANNRLFIIPGGRGAGGVNTAHNIGDTVTLLGFPPFNGQWAGFGYLMPKDWTVTQSPLRPGNCLVSYEGYGNPGSYWRGLSKTFDRFNNMVFTGYWFISSPQASLDNTGVPQVQVTFQSGGHLLTEQKIDLDNITRAKNIFYSWSKATFDQIGYERKIPGDWYDWNMWDPSLPGSYPMTISTEYAQHKAFFDHMADTDMGKTCQYCQQEWINYVMNNENGSPTGSIAEARSVGKHIYKESIRVFNQGGTWNAGPVKTFGRLMHALAMAAWDNPLEGNPLANRWSKLPNQLFDNLQNFINGRVFNGQLSYDTYSSTQGYDWSNQPSADLAVYGNRKSFKCPFTAQYDRQPWSQPMQDFADMNRMQYFITREGYPVLIPIGRKLRGIPSPYLANQAGYSGPQTSTGQFIDNFGNETSDTDIGQGEWFLAYGGSIDSYTHTIDPSGVLTLVYVSCQTAFGDEITFTIPAAGTGLQASARTDENTSEAIMMYSNKIGNREGLQLTAGVQQTDAVSLDNLLLGLEWNTNPASWGLTVKRGPDNLTQVDAQPPIPNPQYYDISFESSDVGKQTVQNNIVKPLQKLINFMMERRYIGPAVYDDNGKTVYPTQINQSGKFTGTDGKATRAGVQNIQNYMVAHPNSGLTKVGSKFKYTGYSSDSYGQWGQSTYHATKNWITAVAVDYIKTDVWWYVQNGLPWEQYVGAITGMPIPQRRDDTDPTLWQIDQNALKTEAERWMKQFFLDAINYGNSVVDDSINKNTQKILNTNLVDPRIQIGDVIWANIPGYLSYRNVFDNAVPPFLNGVYVTGITRTLDLQQGTYQGNYQGYRYRGNYESNVTQNQNNYCNVSTKI